ncbi:hypothetical protein LWI29_026074 [Acer saccharum]|uniref:MGS-like domain-containing protein n=1 Tax=Acer saccharum TaxID=4024 RepID=A0AA39RRE7_ACESA|nr:hypothetical protein LWI29_026074 [Acer saccharum]
MFNLSAASSAATSATIVPFNPSHPPQSTTTLLHHKRTSATSSSSSSSSSIVFVRLHSPSTPRSNFSPIKAMSLSQTLSTAPSHHPHSPAPGNKQVLISLSDKKDLGILGTGLQELGYTIVSTGGTATALEKAGVSVTKVEQLTSFPEMLDGRVKTLHPNIHGGILARRDQKHHMEALNEHGIGTFDIVVVNLYPFYDTVTSAGGIDFENGIENIDIGGPAMIRAAAKNHKDVLVVVDSEDYPALLEYLKGNQDDQQFRRKLAWKAFQHVASYDSAVSEWLWKQTVGGTVLFLFCVVDIIIDGVIRNLLLVILDTQLYGWRQSFKTRKAVRGGKAPARRGGSLEAVEADASTEND